MFDGKEFKSLSPQRNIIICSRYQNGETLSSISCDVGISSEGVRLVLIKCGVAPKSGGWLKTGRENKNNKAKLKARKHFARYGCSTNKRKQLAEDGVMHIYYQQKKNAYSRDIQWDFNLWTWYVVWRDSGKLKLRGRKRGQYVMSRYNDIGPYSKENVEIVTSTANIIEVRSRETGKKFLGTIKDGLNAVQKTIINLP